MKRDEFVNIERATEMDTPIRNNEAADATLKGVRQNIVQSIRAFRVQDLQDAARSLGHHFLYANLATAQSKQDVLDLIAQQFILPAHFGKNFDALYDCMTDPVHKSGPQPGFIVVLESIPANAKFDKEAREQLLDIFRDTADYWAERKVPFRCFYSFSVARSAQGQGERAAEAQGAEQATATEGGEKMPTDKLVDVSPLALRMSSPFNAGYWLAAA
jgi:RNAse (barnase) inhibitor barstar